MIIYLLSRVFMVLVGVMALMIEFEKDAENKVMKEEKR